MVITVIFILSAQQPNTNINGLAKTKKAKRRLNLLALQVVLLIKQTGFLFLPS